MAKMTQDDFVKRATAAHGGKYNYERSVFITSKKPITINCPKHGDITMTAMIHILGHAPRCCANEAKRGVKKVKMTGYKIAQQIAKNNKEMFFFGAKCARCSNTKRYTCNNSCAYCAIESRRISNLKNNGVRNKRLQYANIYKADKKIQTELKNIYYETRKLEKIFGVELNVDHVIPIKGKDVCGLHVPWNLMITTRLFNRSKGAKSLDIHRISGSGHVVVHKSALPWNLKKEINHAIHLENHTD